MTHLVTITTESVAGEEPVLSVSTSIIARRAEVGRGLFFTGPRSAWIKEADARTLTAALVKHFAALDAKDASRSANPHGFTVGSRVIPTGASAKACHGKVDEGGLTSDHFGPATVKRITEDALYPYEVTMDSGGDVNVRETEIAPLETPAPGLAHGFAPGERVVYVGTYDPERRGQTGVVAPASDMQHRASNVRIVWDATGITRGVFPENVARLQP